MGAGEGSAAALCAALAADTSREAPLGVAQGGTALDKLALRAAAQAALGTRFVVVSDFTDPHDALERMAQALRARGDLDLVWVLDPIEEHLPPPARYPLTDGREHLVLDTSLAAVRAAHARELAARREQLARLAARPGTRCRAVRTGADLFAALERPSAAGAP
jgi:uncharacterized protein (DUF58 family)